MGLPHTFPTTSLHPKTLTTWYFTWLGCSSVSRVLASRAGNPGFKSRDHINWTCWCMSTNLACGRQGAGVCLSSQHVEDKGKRIRSSLSSQLHTGFKASMGYMRACFKKAFYLKLGWRVGSAAQGICSSCRDWGFQFPALVRNHR